MQTEHVAQNNVEFGIKLKKMLQTCLNLLDDTKSPAIMWTQQNRENWSSEETMNVMEEWARLIHTMFVPVISNRSRKKVPIVFYWEKVSVPINRPFYTLWLVYKVGFGKSI